VTSPTAEFAGMSNIPALPLTCQELLMLGFAGSLSVAFAVAEPWHEGRRYQTFPLLSSKTTHLIALSVLYPHKTNGPLLMHVKDI